MPLSPRLIRRRIRSVGNTKKITKAMELVAAAKMRRAVAAALKTRAYANLAWGMVGALESAAGEEVHPLLRGASSVPSLRVPRGSLDGLGINSAISHDTKRSRGLYIVMASDRGLCGGFNATLFREVVRDVSDRRGGAEPVPSPSRDPRVPPADGHRGTNAAGGHKGPPLRQTTSCIAIGKKAEQFIRRQGWKLAASFTSMSVAPTVAELRPVARMAMEQFTSGQVDEVRIAFTDFISSLRQQPRVRTLLPLQRMEEVGPSDRRAGFYTLPSERAGVKPAPTQTNMMQEFLFEPSPRKVLDAMLPRLVELQVYQCYLETGASEHSARMLAMRNASDAAKDMIDSLTLTFNQARQAMITREIAEIAAGRAALA